LHDIKKAKIRIFGWAVVVLLLVAGDFIEPFVLDTRFKLAGEVSIVSDTPFEILFSVVEAEKVEEVVALAVDILRTEKTEILWLSVVSVVNVFDEAIVSKFEESPVKTLVLSNFEENFVDMLELKVSL
jgi:hypothetical protein